MRNLYLLLFVVATLTACRQQIKSTDIQKLNGYWEIERVDIPDADHKEYRMNETFDYFEIKNDSGIRKKVRPQMNGTFIVNDTYENVKVLYEDKGVFLEYKTKYSTMKEELIELTEQSMTLKNNQNIEYQYKKTAAIDFTK